MISSRAAFGSSEAETSFIWCGLIITWLAVNCCVEFSSWRRESSKNSAYSCNQWSHLASIFLVGNESSFSRNKLSKNNSKGKHIGFGAHLKLPNRPDDRTKRNRSKETTSSRETTEWYPYELWWKVTRSSNQASRETPVLITLLHKLCQPKVCNLFQEPMRRTHEEP